jgi:hypothetical protein
MKIFSLTERPEVRGGMEEEARFLSVTTQNIACQNNNKQKNPRDNFQGFSK